MARRPLVDAQVDEAVEPVVAEPDVFETAAAESVVVEDAAETGAGDGEAEELEETPVALGSDLPPPVYVPVDRAAWLRDRRTKTRPTVVKEQGDEQTAGEAPVGEPTELDPVFGPPNPDSTAEIMRLPVKPQRPLRKPVVLQRRRKPRVRRVTRIIRHVDTWSVFKVALVFNAFIYVVLMTSGVLLWQVARATGTVDNIERFFESFGWRTFQLNGGAIYHNAWIAGIFVAIAFTGIAVLAATLFNLITDLVGGIRVTVLEEEVRTRDERITPLVPPADIDVDDLAVVPMPDAGDTVGPIGAPIVDDSPKQDSPNEVE